eukprot:8561856-Pyramimonas_sp.AAC.1
MGGGNAVGKGGALALKRLRTFSSDWPTYLFSTSGPFTTCEGGKSADFGGSRGGKTASLRVRKRIKEHKGRPQSDDSTGVTVN